MGIKHRTTKRTGEKGYASEWNEDHIIDSDINFQGYSGINVGEPINPSDIATKAYVDSKIFEFGTYNRKDFFQDFSWGVETEVLNVSGSGYFLGFSAGSGVGFIIRVYIDGSLWGTFNAVNFHYWNGQYENHAQTFVKFDSSLRVTIECSRNWTIGGFISYALK